MLKLSGVPDSEVMDPPRAKADAVYITTDIDYATWYAARSGAGDLYAVRPVGMPTPSTEDHFPTFTVESAHIVEVIRRGVRLTRAERRHIERKWKKADRKAERHKQFSHQS